MKTADPESIVAGVFRAAFAERERISAAEWACRYREIVSGATPGAWDFARAPYLRGIHEAYSNSRVRQVTVMKAEQVGGTEAIFNCLMWCIDNRPGGRLYVYPNIDVARKVNKDRLLPSMRACPRVRDLMGEYRGDQANLELRFKDGTFCFFTGSNSDANLEIFSYRDVIIDELDRCTPGIVGKTRGRRNAYPDAKLFANGTPGDEGVGIDAEHAVSDMRRWWTPCPECGAWHVRDDFAQVKWPHPPGKPFSCEPDLVERQAWYECPKCGHAITAHEHRETSRAGVWLPTGWEAEKCTAENAENAEEGRKAGFTTEAQRAQREEEGIEASRDQGIEALGASVPGCLDTLPHSATSASSLRASAFNPPRAVWRGEGKPPPPSSHAGFHIWGMMSTIVPNPFGAVAREFVEKKGNPGREWANRRLGRPHRLRGARVESAELRKLCVPVAAGGYRMGTCPKGTLCLTFAADIQADRAYCEIRGWGELGRDTGLVWCEEAPINAEAGDMRALRDVMLMRFPMADDADMSLPVGAAAVDSGKWADHVYDFCAGLRREGFVNIYPIKGDGARSISNPITEKVIGEVTSIARHQRNRDTLLVLKVNYWKQSLLTRIRGEETVLDSEQRGVEAGGEAGRWLLPEDAPEEYLLQMTAEERLIEYVSGQPVYVFVPRPGYENRNHYWDAAGYNHALAMKVGVRQLTESAAARIRAERRAPKQAMRKEQERRPGMLGRAGRGILDRGR